MLLRRSRGVRNALRSLIAAAMLPVMVAGCGGDGSGGTPTPAPAPTPTATPTPASPVAPTIAATPAATTVTTAQTLAVAVAVTGPGATPEGTVTLTSGGYTSAAQTLSAGRATITVPAGVLAVAADTLTVRYAPSSAVSTSYTAVSATTAVTVTAAAAPTVTAQSTRISVNGRPFAAVPLGGNLIVSVSNNGQPGSQTGLAVYTGSGSQFAYKCTQAAAFTNSNGDTVAFGTTATPNGAGLALAVDDAGLALLSRAAVLGACNSAVTLVSQGTVTSNQGTFDVAVTPDGRYAFVANEYGVVSGTTRGNVGVVALSYDANGTPSGRLLGQIATGGSSIAGVTISPDGTRIYVTSEIFAGGTGIAGGGNTILAHPGCQQDGARTSTFGIVSVIDVAKAVAAPGSSAIITTTAAGCSPVRVVETANGEVIWVAARGDNRVLAFSTRTLETNPDAALLGYVNTGGQAPVGLALFNNDQLLAVANSNRFAPTAVGNLTIINAVPVGPTVVQTIAAEFFPRSVTVAADKTTLYLTNYNSESVQAISTTTR